MTPEILSALRQEDTTFTTELVRICHEYERGFLTSEEWSQEIDNLEQETRRRLHAITDPMVQAHHSQPVT